MKSVIAVTCGVLCSAAVLSAQVSLSTTQAGSRGTVPASLGAGAPNPGGGTGTATDPGSAAGPATPNPEPRAAGSALPAGPDLARVQALYASAAYEDALAAMPAAAAGASRDIEQYRALCLLALGRQNDAAAAVDRIVSQDPLFSPSGSDTPPRLQAMYTDARGRLAPALAKSAYQDAKEAYEKKDRPAAHEAFQRTLDVIALVPDPAAAGLSDLRELASGFLQLTAAAPGAAAPAAVLSASANARPAATASPRSAGTPAVDTAVSAGAVAPAGSAVDSAGALDGQWQGPVAIRQDMPGWQPPDATARRLEYRGRIHITIGDTGRVEDVKVLKASHPAYDAAVERAARLWQFSPATRGGRPVASEKDIDVYLRPQ